jgi:enoyl-CoA hydratase/carnithine racemase
VLTGEHDAVEDFFAQEYPLNRAIAEYPKFYVALIDGLCMVGGIGVHGTARVPTEHASLAMPETAIGFFPDIGATYILPRLPGALGMLMALTGARVEGADSAHAGLARGHHLHQVSQAQRNPEIAAHAQQDDLTVEVTCKQFPAALKLVHGRLLPFRSQHSPRPTSFAPQLHVASSPIGSLACETEGCVRFRQ